MLCEIPHPLVRPLWCQLRWYPSPRVEGCGLEHQAVQVLLVVNIQRGSHSLLSGPSPPNVKDCLVSLAYFASNELSIFVILGQLHLMEWLQLYSGRLVG